MLVPEPIHSLQNPQIKRLVRLRSRREREAEGVWLVEGARELRRALDSGMQPQQVFACPELFSDDAHAVFPALSAAGRATLLSRAAFEKVSGRENPDGLLALTDPPHPELPVPGDSLLLLVLMGLEKPGNLGALLRTADGVGVDAVLVVGDGTDLGNPGVIRASQGSVFTQPVVALPEDAALTWLQRHDVRLVACTPEAEQLYWDAPLTGRVALCLGSEHDGLPPRWRERAGTRVRIPMDGHADSLNVSVAGALVLYEALRQRQVSARGRP